MLKRATLVLVLLLAWAGVAEAGRFERVEPRTRGRVSSNAAPIYGVTWDETTDSYTYLGALSDLTPTAPGTSPGDSRLEIHSQIRRCVIADNGSVVGYLDPNDSTRYVSGAAADIDGSDGSVDGQVMVEIPRFYYRYSYTGTTHSYEICETDRSGFTIHPAFVRDGAVVTHRYIGAYEACLWDDSGSAYVGYGTAIDTAVDVLSSVSGVKAHTDEKRFEYRLAAANRGAGWRQLDFYLLSAVQLLYVIEYADFNTQETIGNGNTAYSAWSYDEGIAPAGLSNSDGNGTAASNDAFSSVPVDGSATNGVETSQYATYRGIENLWGSVWEWVDGINVHNYDDAGGTSYSRAWVSGDRAVFADDTATGYTQFGDLAADDGYADALIQSGSGFLPTGYTGASNTHLGDYYYTYFDDLVAPFNDWRVVRLGGTASNGATAGAFCVYTHSDSAVDYANLGGRLCY